MAAPPIPSALDARTQTFPTLTPAQINRLLPHGKVRKVEVGEILFEPGDTGVPFFVVLSGSMEIVQPDLKGERLIVKQFSGTADFEFAPDGLVFRTTFVIPIAI